MTSLPGVPPTARVLPSIWIVCTESVCAIAGLVPSSSLAFTVTV